MADSSKTEKATPKKRRDERKKGNVFLSNDAIAVVTLFGSFFVLKLTARSMAEQIQSFIRYCIACTTNVPIDGVQASLSEIGRQGMMVVVKTTGPILAVTAILAVAATFAQTRMLVSGELLKPKFNRINPIEGFKRLFSLRSIIDAMKGSLKIAILLIIIYRYLTGMIDIFVKYLNTDIGQACQDLFNRTFLMVLQIAVAFTVLAGFDFFYQWWEYERKMKMSKQEVKEEYKQIEGDPKVKGKIKEIQRKIAQSRMMQQVPGADVVIRNPTHFAVALRYQSERDNAPVVLAKGQDELALRIVKVAEEHNIKVVENVPLARALYSSTELNKEIPPEFYGEVAEVLVYLYRVDAGKS